MTIKEKIERSKSQDKIDFSKYQSSDQPDPLVKVESTDKILVEPYWTTPGDFEGDMYADYISEHPEYDGVYVRSELLKRLKKAADNLGSNLRLVVRAGHRPKGVQKRLLIECAEDYKKENPGITNQEAIEHARIFVNDPETTLPPHVCGAAVDVELINTSTNKLLDFGIKINEDDDKSFLYADGLTAEQQANRALLVDAMLDAGFASCKPEWWHFSYGDQVWAWFYGYENSLYSPLDI